jgi:hypothetical protein
MHYGKQPQDSKMTEHDDHHSTCTVENNQMHDTSSQKRSLKHRKRPFQKLSRKHEHSGGPEDKMKSKRSHHDSMKKPYSKGPSKQALFRGLFNKSNSTGSQGLPNSALGATNNSFLKIQNVINQMKLR